MTLNVHCLREIYFYLFINKKNMTKRILALLATSLLVLALAGCNAPASEGEEVVDEVVVEEEAMEEEVAEEAAEEEVAEEEAMEEEEEVEVEVEAEVEA